MKRLTILGIIACVGLLFAPAAVLGAGPPGGLEVKVVDPLPLPVTGDVNATVTGEVDVTNTPDVTVVNDQMSPIPVTVQNVSNGNSGNMIYGFVGYSAESTQGGAGRLVMNQLCQDAFGTTARMCTTGEYYASPVAPTETGHDRAWIQPVIHQCFVEKDPNGRDSVFCTDTGSGRIWWGITVANAGGGSLLSAQTCGGWQSAIRFDKGTAVTTLSGGLSLITCESANHVTCCAPQ